MLAFESHIIIALIYNYLLLGSDFVRKSEVKRHIYSVKNQGQAVLKCFEKS